MNEIDDIISEEKSKEVVVEKPVEKEVSKFKPGVGLDIGTSNVVVCRQCEDGTFVNRFHRDMLYPLDISDESADLLKRSDYLYVKVNSKYYVVGEDALRLVNAIGKGDVVRPMKDGILNPSLKESSELLFYIIKAVVGEPIIENEPIRFSIPANPVDQDIDNLFHKMVLGGFLKKLGYDPKPVNEAMCVVYDCNPKMKNDDNEEVPLSGVAVSCGGGMWNIAMSFKGLPLVEFSCTKSGDYLDQQASNVTGVSKNKVIKIKEKKLDLNNVDMSDRVQSALSIYYDEMIERMIHYIAEAFNKKGSELDGEAEIVVAGGTSMASGFCERLEAVIKNSDFPINVSRVRHSETPFYSVSQGACMRAQADFEKTKE